MTLSRKAPRATILLTLDPVQTALDIFLPPVVHGKLLLVSALARRQPSGADRSQKAGGLLCGNLLPGDALYWANGIQVTTHIGRYNRTPFLDRFAHSHLARARV